MAMKECIIELVQASYSYNEETLALKDINIKINKGERIAILGNNGAGKSTFFLLLNGILPLQNGKIIFHGKELKHNKKDLTLLRKEVGFVFQDPDNQIIAPTVESEISFGLMNLNLSKEVIKDRLESTMEELNLIGYKNSPPHYLSGGEKKES
jgi:cobalt/nickel transport system ATP-binding protein